MEDNPTWILVVAGALVDGEGRLLMHHRPAGKPHAGLWEFPGGKVERFESPAKALVRELFEELGIHVAPDAFHPAAFAQSLPCEHGPHIVILLYTACEWQGSPVALEGGRCDWFSRDEAEKLAKPPLDDRLLAMLPPILPNSSKSCAEGLPSTNAPPIGARTARP